MSRARRILEEYGRYESDDARALYDYLRPRFPRGAWHRRMDAELWVYEQYHNLTQNQRMELDIVSIDEDDIDVVAQKLWDLHEGLIPYDPEHPEESEDPLGFNRLMRGERAEVPLRQFDIDPNNPIHQLAFRIMDVFGPEVGHSELDLARSLRSVSPEMLRMELDWEEPITDRQIQVMQGVIQVMLHTAFTSFIVGLLDHMLQNPDREIQAHDRVLDGIIHDNLGRFHITRIPHAINGILNYIADMFAEELRDHGVRI